MCSGVTSVSYCSILYQALCLYLSYCSILYQALCLYLSYCRYRGAMVQRCLCTICTVYIRIRTKVFP